jgi:hypothetical protein
VVDRSLIDTKTRDWYSVSVDTLRAWGIVLVLAALVGIGYFGYRYWERYDLQRRAADVIAESRGLVSRLNGTDGLDEFHADYQQAVQDLTEATAAFNRTDFLQALDLGRASKELLESILEAAGVERGGVGQAQFISVQGRVEYRRGDGGDWQDARARTVLYNGDHVKTGSNGSAEIMFLEDGTLYTARPDTQLIVSRSRTAAGTPGEQAIRMDYGWVNLNTSRRGGKVATPEAEARVASDSEATVTYDAETKTGRFATYRGAMEVAADRGEERRVGRLEQVVQRAGRLAGPVPLPPAPALSGPDDNVEVDLDGTPELALTWQPVPEAESYAVQVSPNSLFVDNVIDVKGRESTRATLGMRAEGSFNWRVAAAAPGGDLGPWSSPRAFRVSSLRRHEGGSDREPPPLELDEIEAYGSIFIVGGKTEAGISVEVNGEPVQVAADGKFIKTIQITKEGWSFIEIRARDAEGNETALNPRVFVEIL